jgi:hypothetical protein
MGEYMKKDFVCQEDFGHKLYSANMLKKYFSLDTMPFFPLFPRLINEKNILTTSRWFVRFEPPVLSVGSLRPEPAGSTVCSNKVDEREL